MTLQEAVDQVLAQELATVDEIRAGKTQAIGRLIGCVRTLLPASNPLETKELLEAALGVQMPVKDKKEKATQERPIYLLPDGRRVIHQWSCSYTPDTGLYGGFWCSLEETPKVRFHMTLQDLMDAQIVGHVIVEDL